MNFNDFENLINGVSRRMTRDSHLREDLQQEMRLHLWLTDDGLEPETAFNQAKNCARRYLRGFKQGQSRNK